jgi:hypothetical protein
MKRILGILVALALLAVAGNAQTFRGAINGTVTDPSGAVVAGASVKATNSGTGIVQTTTTTSDGQYSFQDLPLGTYSVAVTASGFPMVTVEKVEVTAGSAYTLPVKLSIEKQTTTVEVSAAALMLNTTTATQDNILTTEAVQDVPMNGRDFTQFAAVQPGYGGYSVGGFGSLNGTRANQMNWQIDGVDNNDFWHNIPAVNQGGVSGIAGTIMPLDAIDEFAAQTQSNAEGGRNAGGIVNVVLRSGTNQLHGSAYYFNRNEAYGAASPFTPSNVNKPELRNYNFGFAVGGPIIKDKTFYFLTFEKQRYVISVSGKATEPSAEYIAAARALIASHPSVTESPISTNLINSLWPSSVTQANLGLTTGNFFGTDPSIGYSYNGNLKLDHNFNDKHHLMLRAFNGQGDQIAPLGASLALATASSNLFYYFEKAPIHLQNYSAVLNSVLSPRVTNQILFGVNYFNQTFNDANHSFDVHAMGLFTSPDALIHGQPILGAPSIAITGFEQVGITNPSGRNDITGMLTDIVSYNVGKHQFRFGGEMRQGHVDEFYFRHSRGAFNFDGSQGPWPTCGSDQVCLATNALADFLVGDVASSSIAVGNAERKVVVNGFDFFAQDSWQLTRRLNVNWGLRWDYFGPLHSSHKDLAVFIPSAGGIKIQGNGISDIFPPDKNNFAPRLGFAYQPTSREDFVVRGGFGVFYDQINMNPFLDFRPPNAADGLEDNPAGPSAVSTYAKNVYTWQPNTYIFNPISTCLTGNVATDPNCGSSIFDVFSVNQNFRTPYFFNYNLNVQKSFGNGMAVWQVGYVGSQGRKLSIMLDINQLAGGATIISPITGNPTTEGALAQFPNYGGINQLNSIGTSNYNALQSTLRLRAWHGLTSQFVYTWAHALDEITAYRGAIPRDSTNLKAEYGNGDFDTRHNFSATFTWDIPGSSHGPKILTHGWQVNSLMTFHGGQPIDGVRTGFDQIANPFAGVSHSFNKSGVTWINPNSFAPGSTFLGNLRRNQIFGPGFSDVDLSVFKNIPITERVKAQFRIEMFNTFNRVNLASGIGATGPGSGVIADTIGDFNGAPGIGPGEAFNMQLGLKIIF